MTKDDHITVGHLLPAQIEAALRNVLTINGVPASHPSRFGGGYQLKVLGAILSEQAIKLSFGDSIVFYFKSILIDSRGLNIRNDVLHGDALPNRFNILTSDRLIHILLCIGLLRMKS